MKHHQNPPIVTVYLQGTRFLMTYKEFVWFQLERVDVSVGDDWLLKNLVAGRRVGKHHIEFDFFYGTFLINTKKGTLKLIKGSFWELHQSPPV